MYLLTRLCLMVTPTQNLSSLRSFISHMADNSDLKVNICKRSQAATKKSSMWMPVRTEPDSVSLKHRQYSHGILTKPILNIPLFMALFQVHNPCGKLYRPFCSPQI